MTSMRERTELVGGELALIRERRRRAVDSLRHPAEAVSADSMISIDSIDSRTSNTYHHLILQL